MTGERGQRRVEYTPELLADALVSAGGLPEDVRVLRQWPDECGATYRALVESAQWEPRPEGARVPKADAAIGGGDGVLSTAYRRAWAGLLVHISGSLDGAEKAAERGSADAAEDLEVWRRVEGIVNEVADEHGVAGVWDNKGHSGPARPGGLMPDGTEPSGCDPEREVIDDTPVECPEGCMEFAQPRQFRYVDGSIGTRKHCTNCGAGLVEITDPAVDGPSGDSDKS